MKHTSHTGQQQESRYDACTVHVSVCISILLRC